MADNYDGSVIIKTGLDLNTIANDAEELKKAIAAATRGAKELQAAARASGREQIAMLRQANAGWKEQLRILTQIRTTMTDMPTARMPKAARPATAAAAPGTVQTETSEYRALSQELAKAEAQFQRLYERELELQQLYGEDVGNLKSYQLVALREENMADKINAIKAQMQALEQNGGRYLVAPPQETQREAQAVTQLSRSYTQLSAVTKTAKTEGVKTVKAVQHHSALSLKNVLKYAFGIRSMFFLMRRLRAVAKESLGVMAQFDPKLNGAISKFMTSVKQLKADFGTMLQPLVQAGAPIFAMLIDKVGAVAREIAAFFAAFAGQDYINVATVQAVDYADSLDDVADSAEKASEALGTYDKLNVISDSSKEKDAKNTLALTKDTVKYTKKALDNNSWTVKLGRRVRELFDDLKERIKELKKWVEEQPWFESLKKKAKEILNDPDKLMKTLGIFLVGKALGKYLLSGIAGSGFTTGISALIPKAAAIALTAVVGYKIGNYIFNNLPEGLQDELGKSTYDFLAELKIIDSEGNGRAIGNIVKDWMNDIKKGLDLGGEDYTGDLNYHAPNHIPIPVYTHAVIITDREAYRKAVTELWGKLTNWWNEDNKAKTLLENLFGKKGDKNTSNWITTAFKNLTDAINNRWDSYGTKEMQKVFGKIHDDMVGYLQATLTFTGKNDKKIGNLGSLGLGGKKYGSIASLIDLNLDEIAKAFDSQVNGEKNGTTQATSFINAFNRVISGDISMSQTMTAKMAQVISSSYSVAAALYNALYSPLLSGKVTGTAATSASASTTSKNDIVLKLDGKTVAKAVWDESSKKYKQVSTYA